MVGTVIIKMLLGLDKFSVVIKIKSTDLKFLSSHIGRTTFCFPIRFTGVSPPSLIPLPKLVSGGQSPSKFINYWK